MRKLNLVHYESIFLISVLSSSPSFPSKPQLLFLTLIICYFAPLQTLMPQHHSIFSIISLCHPSYLSPSSSSLPMPLLLKPEGLSRSTQITSLRLCICFQFCAINQTSLGMFLSIFFFNPPHFFLLPCLFLLFGLFLFFSVV